MSELLLDSLEIKGYRCFEHLTIEKVGRVNLIVGKNNVGKTALLEALWIYGTTGSEMTLLEIAYNRNESDKIPQLTATKADYHSWAFQNLFTQRPVPGDASISEKPPVLMEIGKANNDTEKVTVSFVRAGMSLPYTVSYRNIYQKYNTYFLRFGGLRPEQLLTLWRKIELTDLEDSVVEAVKLISNDLVSIRLIEFPQNSDKYIPLARTKFESKPVQLRSLGEGMNRLFEIALALVNCRNGLLLIDEIEMGIHYSIQPNVWRLIFKTARDLNVQVFATTHSWDCIEAFTEAAIEDKESEGMLIRLENKNDKIKATTFSEKELEAVTRRNIEVR